MSEDDLQAELLEDATYQAQLRGVKHLIAAYEICGLCREITMSETKDADSGGIQVEADWNTYNRCEECNTFKRLQPQVYQWVQRIVLGRASR